MKVLIADGVSQMAVDILKDDFDCDVRDKLPAEELLSIIPDYDALIVRSASKVTAEVIAAAKNLKIIGRAGVGVDNIDVAAATDKGIIVINSPGGNTIAATEHTFAMMMAMARHIPIANETLQKGEWNRKKYTGVELKGKTLGVIGMGRIGSGVAKRAYTRTRDGNFALHGLMGFDLYGKTAGVIGTGKIARVLIGILQGFGLKVLAYDVFEDKEYEKKSGIKYVTLDELYKNSDIISLNCPLTADNRYLINKDSIAKMKKGVMIINTGRGPLINSEDLVEALKSGQVGAAGLDVYEEEHDYFYQDRSDNIIEDDNLRSLMSLNNVLITSHQAFFTHEAMTNIVTTTLQNAKDFYDGKELVNEVNAQ